MKPELPEHSALRPAVIFFVVFVFLQLVSGALLYAEHIGFAPAAVLEYYRGSEAMLARYPEAADNFRPAKTPIGLIKIALGHLLAYGVQIFILAHWLRSLGQGRPGASTREGLALAMYLTALADVSIAFPIAFGPDSLADLLLYLRAPVFFAFETAMLIGCGYLLWQLRGPTRAGSDAGTSPA